MAARVADRCRNEVGRVLSVFGMIVLLLASSSPAQTEPISVDFPEPQVPEVLSRPVSCDFQQRALNEALRDLMKLVNYDIRVDRRALSDAVIPEDLPICFTATELPLQSVLTAMLEQYDLTWIARHGALYVTTEDVAGELLVTRIYPVADLISQRDGDKIKMDAGPLIDTIVTSLQMNNWLENGGNGTITFFPGSASLVISQTWEIHQLIEKFLMALRQAREQQPVEWERVIAVAPAKRCPVEIPAFLNPNLNPPGDAGPTYGEGDTTGQ